MQHIPAHRAQRYSMPNEVSIITLTAFVTVQRQLLKPQKALSLPQFPQQHLGSERAVGMLRPTQKKLVLRNAGLSRRYGTQMMRQQPWYEGGMIFFI